ncbi:MAG: hypothetical protein JXL85_09875 [Bacilli bacterium]|nr:hypothetical protein [Bacilli bacterium]
MKEILTKKLLIIFSVVSLVVVGAIVLAFATGNTYYPELSDPDGIFYQRVDEDGNVIYTITNQELFEEIKGNDGIQQLLYMTDSILLSEYINQVTQDEIDEKILQLTYGTSDADLLAELDDDTKTEYEIAFQQSMILAGFQNNEDEYARLIIAREKYVMEKVIADEMIAEKSIVQEYIDSYFGDISAIKIRFTSKEDGEFVMHKFHLLSMGGIDLREYKGFIYDDETLKDPGDDIVEAYITIDVYYFDSETDDLLDADDEVVYELGFNDIYTDSEGVEYHIDPATGNLVDGLNDVIVASEHIFDTKEDALAYKQDNTEYFTVTRSDPYDMDQTIEVRDGTDTVVYTIDPDGDIFDTSDNNVTNTTDLVVNKIYTDIEDVTIVTSNNSSSLTEEQVLAKYIDMYNYVYGIYRETLPVGATAQQLTDLDNEFLHFNFDDEYEKNSIVADYMFSTLTLDEGERFSKRPVQLATSSSDFYYMIYKLDEASKENVMDKIFNYLIPLVVIPTEIADSITLPTTTYYNGAISWSSGNSSYITSAGVVTNPEDSNKVVNLTFTITVLGKSRSTTIPVTILKEGETETVTTPTWEEVPYRTLINDPTAYSYIFNKLADEYVYGSSGIQNIDQIMMETRSDLGFQIFDHYVGMDYQAIDSTFVPDPKGSKEIFASYEKTLTSDEPLIITADELFEFALTKNAALYTTYASQYKELLYSPYFTEVFGTQKDLSKNKADRMDDMFAAVQNAKEYYSYLQQLYANYGMAFGYEAFSDYAYSQYGTKTELALLQYFVAGELQPYLINETVNATDIIDALYPVVEDYYDNYFSLDVSHLLIYMDFDEDGSPDDFFEYKDELTQAELDAFNILQAGLEIAIDEYEGTFAELIDEFNEATREDETWGLYKQNGFFILTENLNAVDADDSTITHSLTYSGEYGVKDTYVQEYVDALIALYQEYQLEQNLDKTELYSDLVMTKFGLHVIKASQGDDFEQPTCEFEEEDPLNPEYSEGSENPNGAPTLEQMQLYALYKFYSMTYDLTNADVEEIYNITIPKLPASVTDALDFYLSDLLNGIYVIGTINVNMTERLLDGEFVQNSYTTMTNTELMAMIEGIGEIYFDAIFGEYITE